jgi:hypothetical protein
VDEQLKQIMKASENYVEKATPWLLDVGTWIFGGLIAFNLLIMAALITIGPVDLAVRISTAAFALVLPLDLAGLLLLKLVQDLEHVGFEFEFEREVRQAVQDVAPAIGEPDAPPMTLEALRKRRTQAALYFSLGILMLSSFMTLAGMAAVLWHMAWWIAVGFVTMALLSLVVVLIAMATSRPPESAEAREQRRRYRQEMARRAKAQSKEAAKRTKAQSKEMARKAKEQAKSNAGRA